MGCWVVSRDAEQPGELRTRCGLRPCSPEGQPRGEPKDGDEGVDRGGSLRASPPLPPGTWLGEGGGAVGQAVRGDGEKLPGAWESGGTVSSGAEKLRCGGSSVEGRVFGGRTGAGD